MNLGLRAPAMGAALVLGAGLSGQTADVVLHNGNVMTVDAAFSRASAVAISGDRILAVGGEDLWKRYPRAHAIDLRGRTVLPGFNDTHIHVSGDAARHVDLADARSLADIQSRVRAKAKQLGAGEWVTGSGWSEDQLSEKRRPLRADLDAAAPDNPVVLSRAGGHSAAANSQALKLAAIGRDTPDPPRGVIERDADGEPNGIVRERGDLFYRHVPRASAAELRASLIGKLRGLLRLGITSIIVAGAPLEGGGRASFDEWQAIYRQHGAELPRAAIQIYWAGEKAMRAFGRKTGDGDQRLRVGAVKLLVDGGFTGPAAYTIEDYKGQPSYRGKLTLTEQELYETVRDAHALGWQLGFHTIGDAAIALTVDVFERVLRENQRADHRHYLNHFSMLPPERTLRQMTTNAIAIAQQPNFTYTLEGRYAANLDGSRLEHNNPVTTPMKHGIFMTFGSDNLPIGPMTGLYAAVTRRGLSGRVYGAAERVGMREALVAYTRNGAFLTREENLKGTIEPGRLADLIVLPEDPTRADPARLLSMTVDMTILGGRVVWERRESTRESQ